MEKTPFKPKKRHLSSVGLINIRLVLFKIIKTGDLKRFKAGDIKRNIQFRKIASALFADPSIFNDKDHAMRRLHYLVTELLRELADPEEGNPQLIIKVSHPKGDNSKTFYKVI